VEFNNKVKKIMENISRLINSTDGKSIGLEGLEYLKKELDLLGKEIDEDEPKKQVEESNELKEKREKLLWAKVNVDKDDLITEAFIIPNNWRGIIENMKDVRKINNRLTIWGADLFFGDVENPIAGTALIRKENQ